VDPMAGVGTIPIEASQVFPLANYFSCDMDPKSVKASQINMMKYELVYLL